MSQFDTNSYVATGSQSIVTTKDDGLTVVAITAPSDAKYDLEFTLDSSGERHKLVQNINGDYNALIRLGVNGVGLDITTLPSGTVIFEVLSEIDLTI